MLDDCTATWKRASSGDVEAQGRLVESFSPLLLAQARFRLGPTFSGDSDAEDLVQDVWLVALPKLERIRPRDGRVTPVLVRYLCRTLLFICNEKLRRAYRGAAKEFDRSGVPHPVTQAVSSAWHRVARNEAVESLRRAMDELSDKQRQVVVLRGFEQWSNQDVARLMDEAPDTVSQMWHRARRNLEACLPAGIWPTDASK